jgi:heptosyltransferase-1
MAAAAYMSSGRSMTDFLFIKTSSMGDIIHHMPALTDARTHFPQARLVWMIEEMYAPLARLHPAVDEVIPVAWRRWRKSLSAGTTWREIAAQRQKLQARAYDAVIDTQGLIRTAAMARSARGTRHGYDRNSIREPLAAMFYDVRHAVSRDLHAIERNRQLTGLALGYRPEGPPDYGFGRADVARSGERYAVLLHGTARPEKEWPVANWIALARSLQQSGRRLVLPWGSEAERVRAREIADSTGAQVADWLTLEEAARLIAGAEFVVGGDTGLIHLAAAFGVPLVAMFLCSDPALSGPIGTGRIEVLGAQGRSPSADEVVEAARKISP